MKIFYLIVAILMFVLGILNLLDGENDLSYICFLLTIICCNSHRIKKLEEKDEKN